MPGLQRKKTFFYILESAIRSGEHPTHHSWKIKNGTGPNASRDERGRYVITAADSDAYIAKLKLTAATMPTVVAALRKHGANDAMTWDRNALVPDAGYAQAKAESVEQLKAIADETESSK